MSVDTTGGHGAMDYAEHIRTYHGFIRLTQITVVLVAILLIFMAMFLV
ncbi:MAG: aa3-type cytochrome c oxidase subunit IV [Hyphomicrobiaceae bacterium]